MSNKIYQVPGRYLVPPFLFNSIYLNIHSFCLRTRHSTALLSLQCCCSNKTNKQTNNGWQDTEGARQRGYWRMGKGLSILVPFLYPSFQDAGLVLADTPTDKNTNLCCREEKVICQTFPSKIVCCDDIETMNRKNRSVKPQRC